MIRRKVLLTRAAGTISSQLLPALCERDDLICLDVTNDAGHGVIDDVVIADLANPDIDAYREPNRLFARRLLGGMLCGV